MAGGVGAFLNFYVFPLVGCSLLVLGAWASWALWRPWSGIRFPLPGLAIRVGGLILGGFWGWFLTNLEYARDAVHVTIGFPMPVMTLARSSGRWVELGAVASTPCMVLDLAIGVGLVNAALLLIWKRIALRRGRRRAIRIAVYDL
jgi:hypothetical protein